MLRALFLVPLVALFTGCGASVGTVSGVVMYQGKTLDHGNVQIRGEDGRIHEGRIQSDGSYTIANVPIGQAQVLVTCMKQVAITPDLLKKGPSDIRAPLSVPGKNWDDELSLIPIHFADFDRSLLRLEVQAGTNRYDVPLN